MRKVGIISLGCSRNLVDSEVILGSLKKLGFEVTDVESGVDLCVINTCAFIDAAREESVDAILQAAQLKKEGKVGRLVVCGCLPQLYKEKLLKELPEADLVLGTSDFHKIGSLLSGLKKRERFAEISDNLNYIYDERSPRLILTPGHYAYIKISEGCSNFCSYCIIARLRGAFRSRSIKSVIGEMEGLSAAGRLKEINLIGQDTTLFGIDRYGKATLGALLKKICGLKDSVRWVRVLYTHPAHYSDELISTIREEEKVCKYLDLPIQHANDKILKKMNRRTTKGEIKTLIEKLRKNIPGLTLRTSIIAGFPGESDADFKEVLDFMREVKFEKLGAFIYSKEDLTRAARFQDQVPENVKKDRFDELMKLQQKVSARINRAFLGKTVDVLIDEKEAGPKNVFLGRTQRDAPEVDGNVYVTGRDIKVGNFYKVKITDTLEYDLVGEVV